MMKRFILPVAAFLTLFVSGCGFSPLSPRQDQKIDNQNGKIGEIENMANSLKAEVGTLKQQNDIQNSQLEKLQQGVVNLQSNYDNSGVQILSGPGGLVFSIIAILAVSIIAIHYRTVSKNNEKTAEILAEKIVEMDNPYLEEEVFRAAMHSEVEENVLKIMQKHQSIRRGGNA